MAVFDQQTALRLISIFSGAVKGMAFYPESHPAIRQPVLELDKVFAAAFSRSPEIIWGVMDGIMFLDDHLFVAPSAAVAEMTDRFVEKKISRLLLSSGLNSEELIRFISLFSSRTTETETFKNLLLQKQITHIQVFLAGEEQKEISDDSDDTDVDTDGTMATYGRALEAIRGICRDIERGRIPNSAPVIRIVDKMVGITMQEPSALLGLTMIKDYDNYTFNHCVNVGVLAMALGASIGMDSQSVKELGIAGQLHDIGKTMIPKEILNKPGKLSSAEFEQMKRHSEMGAKIIREMEGLGPHIAQVVLGHHLHYNRSGYPEWARNLPFNSMIDIISIADTYDAITTLRVYQHPANPRTALNEMQALSGTMLCSKLLSSFVGMMGKYPVGTLIRLDTNEVGLVYRPNPLDDEAPLVRILFESDGTRLETPRELALAGGDGNRHARIVAVVDPVLKNIDVGKFMADGVY